MAYDGMASGGHGIRRDGEELRTRRRRVTLPPKPGGCSACTPRWNKKRGKHVCQHALPRYQISYSPVTRIMEMDVLAPGRKTMFLYPEGMNCTSMSVGGEGSTSQI